MRNTGFGTASSMSRVGGMVSPLVAVALVQACHQMAALLLFTGVILAGAVSVLLIPYETKGQVLTDSVASSKYELKTKSGTHEASTAPKSTTSNI